MITAFYGEEKHRVDLNELNIITVHHIDTGWYVTMLDQSGWSIHEEGNDDFANWLAVACGDTHLHYACTEESFQRRIEMGIAQGLAGEECDF